MIRLGQFLLLLVVLALTLALCSCKGTLYTSNSTTGKELYAQVSVLQNSTQESHSAELKSGVVLKSSVTGQNETDGAATITKLKIGGELISQGIGEAGDTVQSTIQTVGDAQ